MCTRFIPGEGRVVKGGVGNAEDIAEEAVEEKGRGQGEESGNTAWEPGGRENAHHPSQESNPRSGGERRGEASFATRREVAGNENSRRRLVVPRSLTRVGLFFNLGQTKREFLECDMGTTTSAVS